MIDPIFDKVLANAERQLACARNALAHDNGGTALMNVRTALAALEFFQTRMSTPLADTPTDSQSVTLNSSAL